MSAIAWEQAQRAIARWVITAGGFPPGEVYWSHQYGRRGDEPYAVLGIPFVRRVGTDWFQATREVEDSIRFYRRGWRSATLTIQCFSDHAAGDRAGRAILDDILIAASLTVHQDDLAANGVGIGTIGDIQSFERREDFEPRAIAEVNLHLSAQIWEAGYAIEHVVVGIEDQAGEEQDEVVVDRDP